MALSLTQNYFPINRCYNKMIIDIYMISIQCGITISVLIKLLCFHALLCNMETCYHFQKRQENILSNFHNKHSFTNMDRQAKGVGVWVGSVGMGVQQTLDMLFLRFAFLFHSGNMLCTLNRCPQDTGCAHLHLK